ncbi:MAG TPA: glycoside hydrolase family 2 TIM barrel-domain containing protein [Polyangiaceae bacterium]
MTQRPLRVRRRSPAVLAAVVALIGAIALHCSSPGSGTASGGGEGGDGGDAPGNSPDATMTSEGDGSTADASSDVESDAPVILGNDAGALPASNRVDINMGVTPWKFLIHSDPSGAQAPTFDDFSWANVGIPHTWNDSDTFVNGESGEGTMVGGVNWYRKHFTVDPSYANRRVLLEFEGVHVGAQVYVNGTFIPGKSAVAADSQATHVVGFLPFVLDITKLVEFGGTDNVIAVRVSMNGGGVEADGGLQSGAFFEDPGFSEVFRFGQADGGIFRPVYVHLVDAVHVPQNVYAVLNTWGTYVGTVSASAASATVRMQTNVENDGPNDATATVTTEVVDAKGIVVSSTASTNTVPSGAPPVLFDHTATIANPTLWYPNNVPYGAPYMYRVWHIVQVNGHIVDAVQSPLGIRTITWNENFPIINGHPMYLQGASGRYDYPALGTAVPEEQQWRDVQLLAAAGGNLWRPGHSTSSPEFVNACDALGVMIVQPSGEGEGAFSAGALAQPTNLPAPLPADREALKAELHRDMIIRDRSHPSILAWETDNGPIVPSFAQQLWALDTQWDYIGQRVPVDRTPSPDAGVVLGCTLTGCEMGVKSQFPNNPAWGAEYWGRQSARYAYDYEIAFVAEFLDNWRRSRNSNAFGIAQWYLAETPGEAGNFLEGPSGAEVRSFGSSMTDFNRIPKLLYYAYQAGWVPYAAKPVVALAHHWNRSGVVTVNAFSNCPKVRLRLNAVQVGADQVPNPLGTATNVATDLTEQSTVLPMEVTWSNVTWAAGTLRADCVDGNGAVVSGAFDQRVTAGQANHIVLTVTPAVTKPDGTTFQIQANGTDAAFILATVVDAQGNWVPTYSSPITFAVAGPGTYRGGSDQLVTAGKPQTYHSPGDPELNAEGGMCKVAVRAQFTPGTVTVTASSAGLTSGATTFDISPLAGAAGPGADQ